MSIPAPRTKGAQDPVDLFQREGPEPRKRWIQKGERQILCAKAAQGHVHYGVIAKKPPRSVVSKSERAATAKTPVKAEEPKVERVTKQERMLTLLSQPEGASIAEMMRATKWQQHSVRGFLAGTVKKKPGFSLTTSKVAGDDRRYRIEMRRTR